MVKKFSHSLCAAALLGLSASAVLAQHAKLDAGLSDLLDTIQPTVSSSGAKAKRQHASTSAIRSDALNQAATDSAGRVLVDIYLDGQVSMAQFLAQLQAVGAEVTGVNPDFRQGAVSAYMPASAISSVVASQGLKHMKMAVKPQTNAGGVLSQGTTVMRSLQVNSSGFTGQGITVGVLSDSYDTSPLGFTTIRAGTDIGSGDLKPPKLVLDLPTSNRNTDEGRAMMQIVLDVAPGVDLCFATAFTGEAGFAANIRKLRTDSRCNADIIVDDVFYFSEPFFSDGQIAQAVNDVSLSTTLAGRPVAYFSSAGNQGGRNGRGSIDIPNAVFSPTPTSLGNINLASISTCNSFPSTGSTKNNVAGGWLTFPDGSNVLPVIYSSAGSTMVMQWNDPFYAGAVTTDLNWYMFNDAGTCLFTASSNNFNVDAAVEVAGLLDGVSGNYRVMVARTSAGTQLATHVRLLNLSGFGGVAWTRPSSPTTFGHNAATMANSVAAYRYTNPAGQQSPFVPTFENFSSPGPVTIYFDAAGQRLPVPETRKKPDFAAPDGGDTTFFFPGLDFEGNGRPNFFGTSAAAPHAAGVAALMLQKAGGSVSLTPKQIKSILQTTTPARVAPFSSGAPVRTWSVFDGFGLVDAVNALNKIP